MIVKADTTTQAPGVSSYKPFNGLHVTDWLCAADQYLKMVEAGVLEEADRVELIEGRIICMSPAEVSHNRAVSNLTRCLMSVMVSNEVLVQCTLRINDGSVVDPDIAILRRPNSQDEGKLPSPQDTLLLIEASHSSLHKDLLMKSELYASAQIVEYWVADIENKSLVVHRKPSGDRYHSIQTYRGNDLVQATAVKGLSLTPEAIFD